MTSRRDREFDAFLRGEPSEDAGLSELARALHAEAPPGPREELLARTKRAVRDELRLAGRRGAAAGVLGVLAAAAPPALLCVAGYALLLRFGAPWLATFLPEPVAYLLVGGYVLAGAGCLSLVWLALPSLAHARNRNDSVAR